MEFDLGIVRANIRVLLKQNGLTQKQLGKILGLTPNNMSNCMNTRGFSVSRLIKISDILGVTLSDLTSPGIYGVCYDTKDRGQYTMTNSGCRALCNAIVVRAAQDYIDALMMNERGRMQEIKRFFHSDWGKMLAGADYSYALKKLPPKIQTFKDKTRDCLEKGIETKYTGEHSEYSFRCPVCDWKVYTHKRKDNHKDRDGYYQLWWSGRCTRCKTEYLIDLGVEK